MKVAPLKTNKRQKQAKWASRRLAAFLALLIRFFCIQPTHAAEILHVDLTELALRSQIEWPWRWDNVEDRPDWVAGAKPHFNLIQQMHFVSLKPGDETVILLPPMAAGQILQPDETIYPDDFALFVSNGSGLFAGINGVVSADSHSIIITPHQAAPSLLRIRRLSARQTTAKVALFISRRETVGSVASNRETLALLGEKVSVRTQNEKSARDFWHLKAGEKSQIQVAGPSQLSFELITTFTKTESVADQIFWLKVGVDSLPAEQLAISSTFESDQLVFVNDQASVITRPRQFFLPIADGAHTVEITPLSNMYVRLEKTSRPAYLLSDPFVSFSASESIKNSLDSLTHLTGQALLMARRNDRRNSGLTAWRALQTIADDRPNDPEFYQLARQVRAQRTFYRDLLPVNYPGTLEQTFGYFLPRNLRNSGNPQSDPVLAELLSADLEKTIPDAYFFPVPDTLPIFAPIVTDSVITDSLSRQDFVLFDFDKSFLRDESRQTLRDVLTIMTAQPRLSLRLSAHTDNYGTDQYNDALSMRRATGVIEFIVGQGISRDRVRWAAYGEKKPRSTNLTDPGRQLNRRVEMDLIFPVQHVRQSKPTAHESCLRYVLPENAAPTDLRIVAERSALTKPAIIYVQFEQETPQQLLLYPQNDLPENDYEIATGEALIARNAAKTGWPETGILTAFQDRAKLTGPLFDCGIIELDLPRHVRRIRIWQSGMDISPVRVAVQYRAAKPFQLSESAYLALRRQLPDSANAYQQLLDFLRGNDPDEAPLASIPAELQNDWRPIRRLVQSAQASFLNSVAENMNQARQSANRLSPAATDSLSQKILKYEHDNDWTSALLGWNELLYFGNSAQRVEALFGRIRALQQSGESYQAEIQLRGLYLYDPDESVRREAFHLLVQKAFQESDNASLLTLAGVIVIREPSIEALGFLTDALLANQYFEEALRVGLLLPRHWLEPGILLPAALLCSWNQVFDDLANQLLDPAPTIYWSWQGKRALYHNQIEQAITCFDKDTTTGQPYVDDIRRGQAIMTQLRSPDINARAQGILDWEDCCPDNVKRTFWRQNPTLISKHAGAVTTYSTERDLHGFGYRATPQTPVRLRVLGPRRLKIEARPLRDGADKNSADGWLKIQWDGRARFAPILNNTPSPGLICISDTTLTIGRAVESELVLEPGLHDIELLPENFDVMIQVFESVPEFATFILPEFNYANLLTALNGGFSPMPDRSAEKNCVVIQSDGQVQKMTAPEPVFFKGLDIPNLDKLEPLLTARLACRLDRETAVTHIPVDKIRAFVDKLSPSEMWLLSQRYGAYILPKTMECALPNDFRESVLTQAGDLTTLVTLPFDSTSRAAIEQRMAILLKLSQIQPNKLPLVLAQTEKIRSLFAGRVDLKNLYTEITRSSRWAPFVTIQNSAGTRAVAIAGWSPESPALRLRQGLLPPLPADENVLFGRDAIGLVVDYAFPRQLTLTFCLQELDFVRSVPAIVFYSVDGKDKKSVRLDETNPADSIRVLLTEGSHRIRLWLDWPSVNQYVRVAFLEQLSQGPATPIIRTEGRLYHLATQQEPIRFGLKGPVCLRVDRRDGERTRHEYVSLDENWHDLEFKPIPGEQEALYRFFYRIPAEPTPPLQARPVAYQIHPLPDASAPGPDKKPDTQFGTGTLSLGGQEDGTWTIHAAYNKRFILDEADQLAPDQFAEMQLVYQSFSALKNRYVETTLLGRYFEDMNSTFSAQQQIRWNELFGNWDAQLSGRFFAQQPVNRFTAKAEYWQGAAVARASISQHLTLGSKWSHRPLAAYFVRYLSISPPERAQVGDVDRDLYTDYKWQHRSGILVEDRLVWQPWQDTEFWLTGRIISNGNFRDRRPDQTQILAGYKQLAGAFELNLDASVYQFFPDEDRQTSQRHEYAGAQLNWEHWLGRLYRLTGFVDLNYNINQKRLLWRSGLSFDLSKGRAYRDFMPGQVSFKKARTLRLWRRADY